MKSVPGAIATGCAGSHLVRSAGFDPVAIAPGTDFIMLIMTGVEGSIATEILD